MTSLASDAANCVPHLEVEVLRLSQPTVSALHSAPDLPASPAPAPQWRKLRSASFQAVLDSHSAAQEAEQLSTGTLECQKADVDSATVTGLQSPGEHWHLSTGTLETASSTVPEPLAELHNSLWQQTVDSAAIHNAPGASATGSRSAPALEGTDCTLEPPALLQQARATAWLSNDGNQCRSSRSLAVPETEVSLAALLHLQSVELKYVHIFACALARLPLKVICKGPCCHQRWMDWA